MPPGVNVSGLESDGGDAIFFCELEAAEGARRPPAQASVAGHQWKPKPMSILRSGEDRSRRLRCPRKSCSPSGINLVLVSAATAPGSHAAASVAGTDLLAGLPFDGVAVAVKSIRSAVPMLAPQGEHLAKVHAAPKGSAVQALPLAVPGRDGSCRPGSAARRGGGRVIRGRRRRKATSSPIGKIAAPACWPWDVAALRRRRRRERRPADAVEPRRARDHRLRRPSPRTSP